MAVIIVILVVVAVTVLWCALVLAGRADDALGYPRG